MVFSRKEQKMLVKESREHPWASKKTIVKIVKDHEKKK